MMNRRTGHAIFWAFAWSISGLQGHAAQDASSTVALGHVPLLFVDDTGIASHHGVVRTLHAARTRAEPVLVADQPWEGQRVYTYGSVLFDPPGRQFRLWYMSRSQPETGPLPSPGLRDGGTDITLYATSDDGVRWDKPTLGLLPYRESKANNLVADLHSPSVLLDRFESDPAKKYKLLGHFHGGYYAAYSPDGIRWEDAPGNPLFKGDDTMAMTQHPVTGEFMVYFKRAYSVPQGRVVSLTRSRDFKTWSEPKLVFKADRKSVV